MRRSILIAFGAFIVADLLGLASGCAVSIPIDADELNPMPGPSVELDSSSRATGDAPYEPKIKRTYDLSAWVVGLSVGLVLDQETPAPESSGAP
ncbi:MAG: hypothetical protein V3T05_07065 [Myxococcota bacterium]